MSRRRDEDARVPHYLRELRRTTIPRQHLVLDVETRPEPGHEQVALTWRLAASRLLTSRVGRPWVEHPIREHHQPFELWAQVHAHCHEGERLIVWCHNLAFDLRASQALSFLPRMGYELEQIALDRNTAWVAFERDGASLHFCDLHTWLPTRLEVIASELGIPRPELPVAGASEEVWMERCRQDVEVTCRAVRRILELVEQEDLGPLAPTGAGQSHRAWRRRFLDHKVLVHDHVRALELERRAQWTGRAEAWRTGRLSGGPFSEYDLTLAYCQIAAELELPAVLACEIRDTEPRLALERFKELALLARIRVSTSVPCLPAEHDGHVVWPVGSFETVVWTPELELALRECEHVELVECYGYQTAPVLRAAARWVIDGVTGAGAGADPIRARMLKHWARAMIGRCAVRYRSWQEWGEADTDDAVMMPHLDYETQTESELLHVGRQLRLLAKLEEGRESLPQIPSFVQSECRARLWALMRAASLEHVVYVDTDSIIVDQAGAETIEWVLSVALPWPWHLKGRYRRLIVHGPRMLELDGRRRMAGIPLEARARQEGGYRGEVWLSLAESLARHEPSTVRIVGRDFNPTGLDRRRRHLEDGSTAPLALSGALDALDA